MAVYDLRNVTACLWKLLCVYGNSGTVFWEFGSLGGLILIARVPT
jgi:hypothetical protein